MNERKRAGRQASPRAAPVTVEISIESGDWPPASKLQTLTEKAIAAACAELDWPVEKRAAISLLFTGDNRMAELNETWRGKAGPTNVLSFPAGYQPVSGDGAVILGDIAFAFETISREAGIESVSFDHHLTHLVIHGFLHLCGYDHVDSNEASKMEGLEIGALARLDIPDPYAVTQSL